MSQLGTIKIKLKDTIVEIPVFNTGDIDYPVWRVQTQRGIGAIRLVDPNDADTTQIRIKTSKGIKSLSTSLPNVNILGEEEGDISQWNGDMDASVVSSPTVNDSDYAIELSTDSNKRYIQTEFKKLEYSSFSFYLYPQGENSELIVYNKDTSDPIFCIYFSGNKDTINYSDPRDQDGNNFSGDNLIGSTWDSGYEIGKDVSDSYQHIQVFLDWREENCDVYLNGTEVLSNVTFSSSTGAANACILTHNQYTSEVGGIVDNMKASSS